MPQYRRITVDDVGVALVVGFKDKRITTEDQIQQIGEELFSLVDGPVEIVLTFENVEYASSAVLGKFITLNKSVLAANGRLAFCCINPPTLEVFRITKLNKMFLITKTVDEALSALGVSL